MKNNLPVILLRGLVLLPFNDLKLEFENDESRNVIDMAELFHDGELLVVLQSDPYEVNPDIKSLPKIGVIAKITHKMVLPNGKVRIVLTGIRRNKIINFVNLKNASNSLEALVEDIEQEKIDILEEQAIIRKIRRELDFYVRNVPNMGNSVFSSLSIIKELDKFTDILVPNIPITIDRLMEYLNETKSSERARMILLDIYKEEELFNIEKELDLKVNKEFDKNQREFILREKLKSIKEELGEVSSKDDEILELRDRLSKLEIDDIRRNKISKEIDRYESLSNMAPELSMERNYIEVLLTLPWNHTTKDNDNLINVKKTLDETHNGLDDVKTRIIEYLAVKQNTNSLNGPIICLVGPPGVGKTTFAYSIASALNRNFVKISVGGLDDEAEIMGHRRTYIGATPGRIINSMIKAKSSNPVFLIDEIDKMTHNINGDPTSALLSVLDSNQNKYFSDNYLEEEYDLSNVLFITTANYIDDIPEPLKDRLEVIKLDGYTEYEKLHIAKEHIIPKVSKDMGLDKKVIFKEDAILEIIRDYTKEAGVRELERLISKVMRKIVTKYISSEIKALPIVTLKSLNSYLGLPIYNHELVPRRVGVINGLAYTPYGGEVLPIETTYFKGKGELILTGQLGDIMKESASIALSYIKANYEDFSIDYSLFDNYDIHIHALEGAIPKEGPSAGVTLVTSMISALTNISVSSKLAMTGEISLHGEVLPIGGLKEKAIGALRNDCDTIIIPYGNLVNVSELPKEINDKIKFIPVKNYKEIYKIIKGD